MQLCTLYVKIISLTINKYESCRQKFKENRILTVTSMYVLEVLCYIKKYRGDRKHNCEIDECNTRSKYDLHTQSRNTSLLQNSVLHMGVRLYKCLPLKIKSLIISTNLEKKWNRRCWIICFIHLGRIFAGWTSVDIPLVVIDIYI